MNKIKSNKGFTQIDIAISIIVLMLFVTLIATLFYNSYTSSTENKRDAESTAYLTQIMQSIDLIEYDNLEDEIILKVNSIDSEKLSGEIVESISEQATFSTPYKVQIKIENFIPNINGEENTEQQEYDLVKIITISISYKNQRGEPITAQRLKTKEIEYEDGEYIIPNLLQGMTPISNGDNNQQTTTYSSNWFDYGNEKVAEITLKDVVTNQNGKISNETDEQGSRFIYIPRFAYMNTKDNNNNDIVKIKFLNTDDTCKDGSSTKIYTETENIEQNKYYIPAVFTQNNVELEGIWIGKYLTRKITDTENRIYINNDENAIWTGLSDSDKETEINKMKAQDNIYGLSESANIEIVDSNINSLIEKLSLSDYSFISNAIEEDEADYTGSFRIYIY